MLFKIFLLSYIKNSKPIKSLHFKTEISQQLKKFDIVIKFLYVLFIISFPQNSLLKMKTFEKFTTLVVVEKANKLTDCVWLFNILLRSKDLPLYFNALTAQNGVKITWTSNNQKLKLIWIKVLTFSILIS